MKIFFSENRKIITALVLFWGVLLILFIANLGFSLAKTGHYTKAILKTDSTSTNSETWNSLEVMDLEKNKLWLEEQLQIAKSDSFSLGINLKDSLLQVQLKGMILFQTKILNQIPSGFFANCSKQTYFEMFGDISRIDSSNSNISKRPITKVIAPPIGTEKEAIKTDSIKTERINWTFITDNQIRVVIYGVELNADSTFNLPEQKDMLNYRIKEAFSKPISKEYTATLFLWLNNGDAKSIYRALPERAKFVFRN